MTQYQYVGPEEILQTARESAPGHAIHSPDDLLHWLSSQMAESNTDKDVIVTFVVDDEGTLRLAPRRSEHVACSGGKPVLSAGEITFAADGRVVEVSNQSTGFCPEPESWADVAEALDKIGVEHPGEFTTLVLFRRCPQCGQRNIVKDDWFVCAVCDGELPREWNFG